MLIQIKFVGTSYNIYLTVRSVNSRLRARGGNRIFGGG